MFFSEIQTTFSYIGSVFSIEEITDFCMAQALDDGSGMSVEMRIEFWGVYHVHAGWRGGSYCIL